ncbi:MAG TPA: type II toxin-antitoxin system prevent-host-death family antitoxin [Thermoanaerobaculia bacterium]|nr:type II toxin-antitoxin system prevent-host-death family antitoxin [Thermoanaerobaculia bacterium]
MTNARELESELDPALDRDKQAQTLGPGRPGVAGGWWGTILVRMTRKKGTPTRGASRAGRWALQDAKARFSEVVRKAKTEGPQRITVHGREEVVVVSVAEYRRVKGQPSGQQLVKLLHDSPLRDIAIERMRTRGRVRGVDL